jgi:hypothetical protein
MRIRKFMKNAEITLHKYYTYHIDITGERKKENRKYKNSLNASVCVSIFLSFREEHRETFFRIFSQYVAMSGQRAG